MTPGPLPIPNMIPGRGIMAFHDIYLDIVHWLLYWNIRDNPLRSRGGKGELRGGDPRDPP